MCSHLNCFIEAIQISTPNILYQNKKRKSPNIIPSSYGMILLGTQERVQIAVINIPTVFEPLKTTVFWLQLLIAHQWDLDFQNQTPIYI